jgi:hypothetical protein
LSSEDSDDDNDGVSDDNDEDDDGDGVPDDEDEDRDTDGDGTPDIGENGSTNFQTAWLPDFSWYIIPKPKICTK